MPQHRPRELTPQEARERGIAPGFTVSMINPEEYHHVRRLMTLAGITDGGGSGTVCEPFTFDQVRALLELAAHREARVEVYPRGWTPPLEWP